ncbi:MAG: SDR family oxidoreductase [Omnitrophica bacterium]|nr:SDR family oxidoreductase [Candidatus Omnitrophota bacterium]
MSYLENLFSCKDKVVVVTGAVGQLGAVLCDAFLRAGAKVVGVDQEVSQNKVEGIDHYKLDNTDKKQVMKVFGDIMAKYKKIDVLVNNAGVSTFAPFEERTEEDFDWVMDVNLKGTFFCIQAYVNLYDEYKLKAGSIINIGSIFGVVSPDFRVYTDTDCPRKNSEIYGATKAGIIQMTKYFAVHLADRGIRVNAVSPGGILNPENPQGRDFQKNYGFRCPMKRMAKEQEIPGAVIYLASDCASYTTGQNIMVDGGFSCW